MMPPAKAPETLPMPPSASATSALRLKTKPANGLNGKVVATATPAAAASAMPMAKAMALTRCGLMPISVAAVMSSEAARTALPTSVFLRNSTTSAVPTSAMMKPMVRVKDMRMPQSNSTMPLAV